jgi:hypothetical protein
MKHKLDLERKMIDVYKIKIIRQDYKTQYKKHIYYSKSKFLKYGSDIYRRYHNKTFYGSLETKCEIYQLQPDNEWKLIHKPKEFTNKNIRNRYV